MYVRIGSTNRITDARLIEEMRRYANREAFYERPMPELYSEAINFRAASESCAEFRRLTQSDLDILRLCATHQGRWVSTERVGETVADATDRAIVDMLDARVGLGTSEIAAAFGRLTRATRTRLARLVEQGLAVDIGTGPKDPKHKYYQAVV